MKSKQEVLTKFLETMYHLLIASRSWMEIRNDFADLIENYIDIMDPDISERLLEISELLDDIEAYFLKLVSKKH